MDLREIKLAQLNRHSILTNVLEPSFFTSDENEQQANNGDVEQSSSPSQNNNVRVEHHGIDGTARTTEMAVDNHKGLTNATRDQQLNENNPHKPQQPSPAGGHQDQHFNSSLGSLELQKRVVKHCIPDDMNMDCLSSRSISISVLSSDEHEIMASSNKIDMMMSLKDSFGNFDQEQESTPTKTSKSRRLSRQLRHTSSTCSSASTSSSVSTPGAYLMRGSDITGRAEMGMITPSNQPVKRRHSCDDALLLVRSSLDSDDAASDSHSDDEETLSKGQELLLPETYHHRHRKRRRCVGVALVIVLVAVSIAVVAFTKKKRLKEIPNYSNSISGSESGGDMESWSDMLTECLNHGNINKLFIGPTLMSTFRAVKKRYIPSDDEEVKACSPQDLALWSISLALVQHENTMNTNQDGNMNTSSPSLQLLSDARYVLSVFFFSLGGSQWNKHFNWLSTASLHECDWFGVECSSGEVVTIDLHFNNLNGTVPTEFYRLTSIQFLDLRENDIKGTISQEIENMSRLTSLNLFETSLSVPLPSELFSLSSLSMLSLSDTNPPSPIPMIYLGKLSKLSLIITTASVLGGSIPTEIGLLTKLTYLSIFGWLKGSIPEELGNLNLMEELRIRPGSLSGTLPDQLFEKNKRWRIITMRRNQLTGTIPTLIGTQKQLQELELSGNDLSGSIPSEIGGCSQLQMLDLGTNRLGATIPTEIGMMNSLRHLSLNLNEFRGTMPTEIARLKNLESVTLPGCQGLLGSIPSLYCEKPIAVEVDTSFCIKADTIWDSCESLSCCSSIF